MNILLPAVQEARGGGKREKFSLAGNRRAVLTSFTNLYETLLSDRVGAKKKKEKCDSSGARNGNT
jgi:hypothetical protein